MTPSARLAATILASAAAAIPLYGIAGLPPSSQLFGRTLIAPRKPSEFALTFDDGPNPSCTPYLLDLLAKYNVKATFFVIGQFAAQEPALVRRAYDEGHLIGNHTLRHPNLFWAHLRTTADELKRTQNVLQQITGQPPRFFRPPFGLRRPATLRIARALGLTTVTWNLIGNDWTPLTAEGIAERVRTLTTRNTERGYATNLVLHDGDHRTPTGDRSRTLAAVKQLLPEFTGTKQLVTLDAWQSPSRA